MTIKEVIRELEAERDSLSSRQIKIQRIIDEIKNLDKIEVEVILTKKQKVRDYTKGKSGKRTKRIYPEGFKEFITANTDKSNPEIIKLVKDKFGLSFKSKAISQYLYLNKLSRKNSIRSKNSKKKHKCDECHAKTWSAWWEGKQLCKRCFALKKKSPRTVERMERKDPDVFEEDMGIDDDALEEDMGIDDDALEDDE